MNNYQHMNN